MTEQSPTPGASRSARYALMTRDAIIDAARKLFAERGYFATTVEDIAAEAQVAPATVYSSAGGKQGVLGEILTLWSSDPQIQQTMDGVAASDDPPEIIHTLARAARQMRERWDDAVTIILTTAPHDSAVAEQVEPYTRYYRQCVADVGQRLADLHALRDGLDAQYATDVLWLYFGYSSLHTLRHDNGWSYDKAERWLARQAAHDLLPRDRATRP